MTYYATLDEIKDRSTRINAVADATDPDIELWCDEAYVRVNKACGQKFTFEAQTAKRVEVGSTNFLYLPAPISGDISIVDEDGEEMDLEDFKFYEGKWYCHYYGMNTRYRERDPFYIIITADWGFVNTTEAMVVAFANEAKVQFNAHCADTDVHASADSTNPVATANATDLTSAYTLLNAIKANLNAHMASVTYHSVADTDVVTAANASTEATAVTLAGAIKTAYTDHLVDDGHVEDDETNQLLYSVTNPILPREIFTVYLKVVQRLGVRDNVEDNRQQMSGYASERFGDGYNYDLSDKTQLSIIQPSDWELLQDYINTGNVTS